VLRVPRCMGSLFFREPVRAGMPRRVALCFLCTPVRCSHQPSVEFCFWDAFGARTMRSFAAVVMVVAIHPVVSLRAIAGSAVNKFRLGASHGNRLE
jgi:hypothetical protein